MFLRRCERRKAGKVHIYWALVESYRTAQGSRQRVITYLGELKPSQQSGWAKLGKRLPPEDRPQPALFDPPPPSDDVDEDVLVQLRGIRLENLRDFGDVWLAWGLWRLLELDTLLDQHLPAGREDVLWGTVAAILTIARFCAPKSELHIEHTWYRRTALNDLIGVPSAQVHTDRLYAGLDRLLQNAAQLRPGVCLIDLNMPEMNGDVLAGRLREQAGKRPLVLVAVSARSDDESRQRTREAGFHLHLIQPVDPFKQVSIVDALWREWNSTLSGTSIALENPF